MPPVKPIPKGGTYVGGKSNGNDTAPRYKIVPTIGSRSNKDLNAFGLEEYLFSPDYKQSKDIPLRYGSRSLKDLAKAGAEESAALSKHKPDYDMPDKDAPHFPSLPRDTQKFPYSKDIPKRPAPWASRTDILGILGL